MAGATATIHTAPLGRNVRARTVLELLVAGLGSLAETLLHPLVILPFLIASLTGSYRTVALAPAVGLGSWLLGSVIAPLLTRTTRRQLPWAVGASAVRAIAIAFLALRLDKLDPSLDSRLQSVFVSYAIAAIASGLIRWPLSAILATWNPGDEHPSPARHRGLVISLFAVAAGVLAASALSADGPGFPRSVVLLVIAAATCAGAATFFMSYLPEQPSPGGSPAFVHRQLLEPLRDGSFRRFLLFITACSFAALAAPFYAIFARERLGASDATFGLYLLALTLGIVLSAPVWRAIDRTGGHRACLQAIAMLLTTMPLIAFAIPYVIRTSLYLDHVSDPRVPGYLLLITFALIGVATRGVRHSALGYLDELAPADRRPTYRLAGELALVVLVITPILGARVLERSGYERLFLTSAAIGVAAILSSAFLVVSRARVRTVASAWRLRGARP